MIVFVSIKSYGDFVILCSALKRRSYRENYLILAASYLEPLYEALNLKLNIIFIDIGKKIPSYYNIKKSNIISIGYSLFQIRKALRHALASIESYEVVFDRKGLREYLIFSHSTSIRKVGHSTNIYLDYINFFQDRVSISSKLTEMHKVESFVICPSSRVAEKRIPCYWIREIVEAVSEGRAKAALAFFQGEPNCTQILPAISYETFASLLNILKEYDCCISSDSLTAHLAEFLDKPVFVYSPIENNYWLPLSSYFLGSHDLFGNKFKLIQWIKKLRGS